MDLMTNFELDDLEGSLCYALLLHLQRTGAISEQAFRSAMRTFAVDLLELLLELESIDIDQLRLAWMEILVRRAAYHHSPEAN